MACPARKGYRVLVVDRATFPSDTCLRHFVHPLALGPLDMGTCSSAACAWVSADAHDGVRYFGPFTLSRGRPGRQRLRRVLLQAHVLDKCWATPRLRPARTSRSASRMEELV